MHENINKELSDQIIIDLHNEEFNPLHDSVCNILY